MTLRNNALMAMGAAALLLPQSHAGTFSADFNDNATPAGTSLNGNNGDNKSGVIENGILKITDAVNSKAGGFVIDDLDAGAPVYGFTFTGKVRVGGGTPNTPADGFSLNFAPDIDPGASGGHEGIGNGITIAFDIYDNNNETPPAPSIDLKVGGNLIATSKQTAASMTTDTNGTPTFADISLTVSPAGGVTFVFKGQKLFDNVYFPGYQPLVGARFAIVGDTGGANDNFWFDDISLTTVTAPQVGIVTNPTSQSVVAGSSYTFAPVLNNTDGATFQWLRDGSTIPGATNATYTLNPVNVSDNNAKFSLKITGPNNTVTTSEATLTVIDLPLPTATTSFDFTSADGSAPTGTTLYAGVNGGGYITFPDDATGYDPGILHLTDAQNDERGVFIIEDPSAGAPVYGISAQFKLLIGGGSARPADGFSVNFASDIPDSTDGNLEDGIGTGLTVGFDIYDNGGGEAPSIDVRYGGTLVAQQKVPLDFITTGTNFANVLIRLQNDGTIDVAYKGVVIFNNLTVPGFSSITGGRIAFAARTGGANANIWVDDIGISEDTTAGDLHIVTQPVNKYVIEGQSVTLTSAVNDPTGVTYQWTRNGTPIGGATDATYTFTASAADNNAQYALTATRGGLTATSTAATITVLSITPTVSFDFNSGTTIPAGTFAIGTVQDTSQITPAYITENGGVDDSGVFHLTDAINGEAGTFVIEPLVGGAEVSAINVAFDVLLRSGGTPADGFSFNWDDNLPETTLGGAENGTGNGLTVAFGLYNGNTGGTITVKWNGVNVAQTKFTFAEILSGDTFRKVIIKVTSDGKLDLVYGDRILYTNLQLPGYTPITNGKFAFYARTGGLNADQWLDNIEIQAIKSTAPLRITSDPADAVANVGQTVTFSVGVSDPIGATYQWFRNGTAIGGATSSTYTTPTLTAGDAGATYTVTVTGPGGTATSQPATLLAPIAVTTPDLALSFDGADPADSYIIPVDDPSNANVAYLGAGGVNDSSALHLTDDVGGQGGAFYIPDLDNGQTVSAFTATFKLLLRSAGTPADGISFVWENDLTPTGAFGEDGIGTGLTVSFDTYDNGGGEAPAITLMYKGAIVKDVKLPIADLMTGGDFADVGIRVEADGTIDVQYKGRVVINNVQLPNFTPISGGIFAMGGRTGGSSEDAWVDDFKIVTSSSVAGTSLSISNSGNGSLSISWTGGGTLQSASSVTGPWNPVNGVTGSPATVTTTGAMQFFRVVQ